MRLQLLYGIFKLKPISRYYFTKGGRQRAGNQQALPWSSHGENVICKEGNVTEIMHEFNAQTFFQLVTGAPTNT